MNTNQKVKKYYLKVLKAFFRCRSWHLSVCYIKYCSFKLQQEQECGPNTINYVLGITKAYTTRVGEGPFPTELKNEIGEIIGKRGKEFGTVTSRKRRCGWFDGVLVRQTIKISGINGIALTKLDVLDELDEIKICIAYEIDGKKIDYLPAAVDDQLKVKANI